MITGKFNYIKKKKCGFRVRVIICLNDIPDLSNTNNRNSHEFISCITRQIELNYSISVYWPIWFNYLNKSFRVKSYILSNLECDNA